LLSWLLKACVHLRINCFEWASDVRRSILSRGLPSNCGIGSTNIQAVKLRMIASCTGGAVQDFFKISYLKILIEGFVMLLTLNSMFASKK